MDKLDMKLDELENEVIKLEENMNGIKKKQNIGDIIKNTLKIAGITAIAVFPTYNGVLSELYNTSYFEQLTKSNSLFFLAGSTISSLGCSLAFYFMDNYEVRRKK